MFYRPGHPGPGALLDRGLLRPAIIPEGPDLPVRLLSRATQVLFGSGRPGHFRFTEDGLCFSLRILYDSAGVSDCLVQLPVEV